MAFTGASFTQHLLCFCSRRSIIVGAGYIAVEIAGILSALGSRAALLIRQDKVEMFSPL